LAFFFAFRDLPMVDLPQHASQIATWLHWDDPSYPHGHLELNFRTPYLLAYGLTGLFAPLVGVVPALKLVVWLAVVGNAFSLLHLARKLGPDPWIGLLGLPTAVGYSFYFGFVSFLAATPIAVLCHGAALDHATKPSRRSGLWLAGLLSLTLVGHGVAFAIA